MPNFKCYMWVTIIWGPGSAARSSETLLPYACALRFCPPPPHPQLKCNTIIRQRQMVLASGAIWGAASSALAVPLFETEDYCEMTNQIFSGNIQPVNPFYISRHSFQAICQTGNWKALIFFCSTILMEHSSKGDATALWWSICMSSSHSWTLPQASQNSSLLQVIPTLAIFSSFTTAPGEEVEHPLILISALGRPNQVSLMF